VHVSRAREGLEYIEMTRTCAKGNGRGFMAQIQLSRAELPWTVKVNLVRRFKTATIAWVE